MVDLKAGQMLFLPAGWFHEVTSYSTEKTGKSEHQNIKSSSLEGCHMALNYWYHPPDALQATDYGSPYQYDFWKREEEDRLNKKASK